jgi:hypothetical protein
MSMKQPGIAIGIAGAALFIRYSTQVMNIPLPNTIGVALSVIALLAILAAVFLFYQS